MPIDPWETGVAMAMAAYADRIHDNLIHSMWMERLRGGLWALGGELHGVPWGGSPDFTTELCEGGPYYDHGISKARGMIHAHLAAVLEQIADEWNVDLHAGCER